MKDLKIRILTLLVAVLIAGLLFISDNSFKPVPVAHASCSITSFSVSPGSPQQVGVAVNISASANCGGGVRAMRILVDGSVKSEIGAPSISATWHTSGAAPGGHTITVEAAENGDNNWSNSASQSTGYELTTPPPPQCSITSFNVSPGSPQPPGSVITLSGSATCSTGVRAIRLKVNGNPISEIGAPSISGTWQAGGSGNYTLEIEAAGIGDNNWTYSTSQSVGYVIQQIDPGCRVDSINASPSSPGPLSTIVTISGSASCANGSVRAMRIKVNGNIISEIGAPSISATWTAPNNPGTHTFTVEASGQGDNNWAFAGSKSMSYEVGGDPQCTVSSINASPPSPGRPGTNVTISGSASCVHGSVRAMRIKVNGNIISEIGSPSISATWTAPNSPGTHTFTVEASGQGDNNWALAGSKSINYEVVPVQCRIESVTASPPSPQLPGTTISITGRASCTGSSVRAIRIKVNDNIISELGSPELTAQWKTPDTPGIHTITVEAAAQGDNNWSNAVSQSISYETKLIPSQCKVDSIAASPLSPRPPGTKVTISGSASCANGSVRAMRIKVNGSIIYEIGAPSISATWTAPNAPGTYTFTVEASGQGDNDWASADSRSMSYVIDPVVTPSPGCRVDSINASPSSPGRPGTEVTISGSASCASGSVRAMRIKVNSSIIYEIGSPSISATWTAPSTPGTYTFIVEASGQGDNNWSLAGSRSMQYVVGDDPVVVTPGSCSLTSLMTDPPSPQPPGTTITVVAKGKCDKGVRAIRIKIDGQTKVELGVSELRYTWQSPGSKGTHRIEAEVAGIGDNQWAYAGRNVVTYVLGDVPPTLTPPGSSQTPGSCRYTWSVGNRVGLAAGAEIRSGSGNNFGVHTRVPENDWLVDIVGGPRQVNGGTWYDVSRAALDGGGSGWVEFSQANYSGCLGGRQPNNPDGLSGGSSSNEGTTGEVLGASTTRVPEENLRLCGEVTREGSDESGNSFLDRIWNFVKDVLNIEVQAREASSFPEGECTRLVAEILSSGGNDLEWLPGGQSYAGNWRIHAEKAGYRVDNDPRNSDDRTAVVVVFEGPCQAAWGYTDGHVGFVLDSTVDGQYVYVVDQNFPENKGPYWRWWYVKECMKFIHVPIDSPLSHPLLADEQSINPSTPPENSPPISATVIIPATCTVKYSATPRIIWWTQKDVKGRLINVPWIDYVLEIPLAPLPDGMEIYFDGKLVKNDDGNIRHDSYHDNPLSPVEEGVTRLGISTKWVLSHFSTWDNVDKWEVQVPCN